MERYFDIAFGPSVRDAQVEDGSRDRYARAAASRPIAEGLGSDERAFVEATDGFYLATATNDGWPYVQYRGGAPGFLKALDARTLAFADFRGNRQLVSVGNARHDDRASLFIMDYARRERLKIFARMHVRPASEDAELRARLAVPGYPGTIERLVTFEIVAFDWNCNQHITQRYTLPEIDAQTRPLRERLAHLEARLADRGTL
ncbi:MAG: pyridoxamine 5'-phosphate oxidase family protein [Vulcanimicrobiaceae bacterium]